jgi:ElaB/YqjD/DUF883 family membrane-anchored ribosome-binding protein
MNKYTDKVENTTNNLSNVIRETGQKASELGERVSKKGEEIIHNAGEFVEKCQHEISEQTEALMQYMGKNPVKSALIMGGVGLLIGFLLRNRH